MTHTLEMALHKSKCVVKELTDSNVVKDNAIKVTVLKNPQSANRDYFVYENSSLKGLHTVQAIGLKYGTSGWEAGK